MTVLRRYLLNRMIQAEEIGANTPRLIAIIFITSHRDRSAINQPGPEVTADCKAEKHIFSATKQLERTKCAAKLCIYEDLTTRFGACNALSA